ncbi:hypothetical protein HBA55_34375 [Pseudomaricurvus alkylphenolicus]|uniref:hypothetical protein n=1 Tax=Pseudomaricurvus alkylphenolicus TaxID=1306991 RepID=UPI00142305B1|nr:hypothetical protein [Pseudomaricurvus alkylphenolicus]NIB44717.1 hypothetical protein [Pseudomaricurvus alkylphenolicus]
MSLDFKPRIIFTSSVPELGIPEETSGFILRQDSETGVSRVRALGKDHDIPTDVLEGVSMSKEAYEAAQADEAYQAKAEAEADAPITSAAVLPGL